MAPYVPKYVSPEKAAQERAEFRKRMLWLALGLVLVFALMVVGYSDQAPSTLQAITAAIDRMLGYPILSLIAWIAR
jgi:hypothetical protein